MHVYDVQRRPCGPNEICGPIDFLTEKGRSIATFYIQVKRKSRTPYRSMAFRDTGPQTSQVCLSIRICLSLSWNLIMVDTARGISSRGADRSRFERTVRCCISRANCEPSV